MEAEKRAGPSSSSFTAPSPGIFGSLFGPTPKVFGRESLHLYVERKKKETTKKQWDVRLGKPAMPDCIHEYREDKPSYENQRNLYPCQLSSSIYYGGPDLFTVPPYTNTGTNSSYNYGEDGSGHAVRGDWWRGSLYY